MVIGVASSVRVTSRSYYLAKAAALTQVESLTFKAYFLIIFGLLCLIETRYIPREIWILLHCNVHFN